jgi:SAM-dependent methyltransferase
MKQNAPAALRTRDPILEVLQRVMPASGRVLEIASGTGQHAIHFAEGLSGITWQPSDPDLLARESIAAWIRDADLPNVEAPVELNAMDDVWPVERADAVVCINMIHIAPWAAAQGLLRGAGRVLPRAGLLFLYGPYRVGGTHTAESNARFDASLRMRDPDWGVRDIEELEAEAAPHGLSLVETVQMPANNLSLIFRKS